MTAVLITQSEGAYLWEADCAKALRSLPLLGSQVRKAAGTPDPPAKVLGSPRLRGARPAVQGRPVGRPLLSMPLPATSY